RLQIESNRLPPFDVRRYELKWQAERLLLEYRSAWLKTVPWGVGDFCGDTFERGFVSGLYARSDHFVRSVRPVPADEPITDLAVGSEPKPVKVKKLLALRGLERIRRLAFSCHDVDDEGAAAIAASEQLRDLVKLDLSVNEIGAAGVGALAGSAHLANLKSLRLESNELARDAIAALIASPLPRLEEFSCDALEVGVEGIDLLLGSDLGRRLTSLSLVHHALGDDTPRPEIAERLAAATRVSTLTSLSFYGVALGDAGLSALARASHLGGLRCLDLGRCAAGGKGLGALARSKVFRGLTVLNLADSDLGDEAVRALALARSFPELRSLSLASQHLGVGATEALGRVDWPLAELDLSSCRLGDAAVAALAACPTLAGLRRLDLSYCKISDAGAA